MRSWRPCPPPPCPSHSSGGGNWSRGTVCLLEKPSLSPSLADLCDINVGDNDLVVALESGEGSQFNKF